MSAGSTSALRRRLCDGLEESDDDAQNADVLVGPADSVPAVGRCA